MNIAPVSTVSEAPDRRAADLRRAAEGFETLFFAQLLKGARASLPGNDLFDGGGLKAAQDMMDAEFARLAGGQARLGIAEAVLRQFAPVRED